ncbi:unnamed protein product, partial [Ectocarpus sp. 12 AP-2014]
GVSTILRRCVFLWTKAVMLAAERRRRTEWFLQAHAFLRAIHGKDERKNAIIEGPHQGGEDAQLQRRPGAAGGRGTTWEDSSGNNRSPFRPFTERGRGCVRGLGWRAAAWFSVLLGVAIFWKA